MALFFKPKKYLGIDIGTNSIKLVELKKEGDKIALNTYGELRIVGKENGEQGGGAIDIMHVPEKQLIDMLRQLVVATRATAKDAVFSLPVFSTFITLIDLPMMDEKEIASSIQFEAKKYIPVPMEEVQFSWSVIDRPNVAPGMMPSRDTSSPLPSSQMAGPASRIQVLIVAVPNEIIAKYKNIAKGAGLNAAFEIETFSIVRSLARKGVDDKGVSVIVDIGFKSTEICLIDNGLLRLSHNFETSGASFTRALSTAMNIGFKSAEDLKLQRGLKFSMSEKSAMDSLLPLIDMIVFEIERTMINYQQRTGKRAQKVILSGGTANMPGLVDYLSNHLGVVVTVADPFSSVVFNASLNKILRDVGPTFSVAIGLAKKNLV